MRPDLTFQLLTKRPERMRAYLTKGPVKRYWNGLLAEWRELEDMPRESAIAVAAAVMSVSRDGWIQPVKTTPWPLPNVWLGVSVEDQAAADDRIPELLDTPAAVRFLSCEPLLGPVFIECLEFAGAGYGLFPGGDPRRFRPDPGDCTPAEIAAWEAACAEWDAGMGTDRGPSCLTMGDGSAWTGTGFGIGLYQVPPGVDWVIVGGESGPGPGARPCDVGWIRDIVGQCRAAEVPVFVKQLGRRPYDDLMAPGWAAEARGYPAFAAPWVPEFGANWAPRLTSRKGSNPVEWPEDLRMRQYPDV
jgi:protein gp37